MTLHRNISIVGNLMGVVSLTLALLCASASAANAAATQPAKDFWHVCGSGTALEVKAMIDRGADVNGRDEDGDVPLAWAAMRNSNVEVIAVLVKAGADVNAKDPNGHGFTVLMCAANKCKNSDVIAALVKAGADMNARNSAGDTALDLARQHQNTDVAKALTALGAQGKPATQP